MIHTPEYASRWLTAPFQRHENMLGPCRVVRMYYEKDHCPSKIIYLMGDVHLRGSDTLQSCKNSESVTDFMKQVVKTSPYMIDFVLETYEYEYTRNSNPTDYLSDLRKEFNTCFHRGTRHTEDCQYRSVFQRVRFHFNDVRLNYKGIQNVQVTLKVFKNFNDHAYDFMIDELKPYVKSTEEWKTFLMVEFKVTKQLEHCAPHVRQVILDWIDEQLKDPELNSYLDAFRSFVDTKDLTRIPTNPFGTGDELMIIFMDAFTVGRMFRTFNKRHEEYSKDMRNVFLYAGNYHIKNYVTLLTRIGCTVSAETGPCEYSNVGLPKQCANVKKLTPWKLINTTIAE